MNQLKDFILQPGTQLYRYDIKEPPQEWNTDFKNPEYVYPDKGVKNRVGAFFFFSSYEQAINTAYCAIQKNANLADGIWITECTISEPIRLLDIRDSFFCIELLAVLDKENYEILTDNFKTWKGRTFSELANIIHPIASIVLDSSWVHNPDKEEIVTNAAREVEKIMEIPTDRIGLLCQLLTDFSNGNSFRRMLEKKGYEGYICNESNFSSGSDTVCVFEANKFQSPVIVWNREL